MDQATTEDAPKSVADLLKTIPGAPDQDAIDGFKSVHGEIFLSGFSETEVYLWRALKRGEWRELQVALSAGTLSQLDYEEQLISRCVLWKPSGINPLDKAGTASTLAEQIMQNSNFVAPQIAAQLVLKL